VCCSPTDWKTMLVLDWYGDFRCSKVRLFPLSVAKLGRRCIGRNLAALSTDADLVWFTDCDHVFGDGCLDALVGMPWPSHFGTPASMVFPQTIQIHRDHATGDQAADKVKKANLHDIDPAEFVVKHYSVAIGGVQIVTGDFARKHGYLDGNLKWQRPAEKPFGDFRDDIAYRKHCQRFGPIVPIELPGLYRIRHSTTSYQ